MVRRGSLGVLARRVGDEFILRAIEHGVELRTAAQKLVAELPCADAARFDPRVHEIPSTKGTLVK